jgi:hypothetical protein
MSNRKYCGNCGTLYQSLNWPRTCNFCGDIAWKNPIPVTFVLQPVFSPTRDKVGLVIAKRANDPGANQWAFVGGFVDLDDINLIEAAKREFKEETGLDTVGIPKIIYNEQNASNHMLIAVQMCGGAMSYDQFCTGVLCPENLELGIMWDLDQVKLCFPIHQKIAERWFKGEI